MAAMKRADAVAYAKDRWYRPTDDNLVWAKSFAINVVTLRASLLAKKHIRADWVPVFLRKQATDVSTGVSGEADGLYFVAPAHAGAKFFERDVPASDRFLAHDWFGTAGVPGSDGGLNDCTTYVSHCLVAGGATYLGPSSPGQVWPTRGSQSTSETRRSEDCHSGRRRGSTRKSNAVSRSQANSTRPPNCRIRRWCR